MRRSRYGRRGKTDDAHPCEKYDFSDEEHCAGQGAIWSARERAARGDAFYKVR